VVEITITNTAIVVAPVRNNPVFVSVIQAVIVLCMMMIIIGKEMISLMQNGVNE
tara:strand:+ start:311 stop:472 length:162 start_codon:yes stop_codon:yes gene_type:complete